VSSDDSERHGSSPDSVHLGSPHRAPAAAQSASRPRLVGRRTLLLGGALAGGTAIGGAVIDRLVGDRPQAQSSATARTQSTPSSPPSDADRSNDPSATAEANATDRLQALLDNGASHVVIPIGTHVLTSTLVVPWHVDTLELPAGVVLRMRGDHIALRRSGRVDAAERTVDRAIEGDPRVAMDTSGIDVGDWLYLCSDDWVKAGKSKVGMLRRVEAINGDVLTLDKPLIRTLRQRPRAHDVTLAPAFTLLGGGAIENSDPQATFSNLIRFDFVAGITVSGVELRNCGSAALRTFGTVGGVIDCHIHDCVDDQGAKHYGYGVSCSSTTRDLTVRGVIERVRHAFTTDHGYDAPHPSMARTGEPEDIHVAPTVRDTTSTGIDTHEPGYGITIVPNITNCGTEKWGGLTIRARNVTVAGGVITDSKEWGILVAPSASGTVIRDVAVDGVAEGRGIECRSSAVIDGGSVSGFDKSFGLYIDADSKVQMTRTVIDGGGNPGARGIALAGTDCSLSGTVKGCGIGVLQLPEANNNRVDLVYEDVAREEVASQ
jgi:hypothetical protein